MERALRKKFIVISVSVVFVVLLLIAAVINVYNFLEIDSKANDIIAILADNDGEFPQIMPLPPMQNQAHVNQETPYTTRFFTVTTDESGRLVSVNTRSIQRISTENAVEMAKTVLERSSFYKYYDQYCYAIIPLNGENLVIFVDCSEEFAFFNGLLQASIVVCLVALVAVFLLIVWVSKWAVAPMVEGYRKQQQFVTNISHELKTPLSIIKTNTEVLEVEHGESQWSESIHNQIGRLNGLVNYLVSLSKLDEVGRKTMMVDFSLSDAAWETVDSFAPLLHQAGKELVVDIAPDLTYCGDEQSIRLLLSTLMENAVKYSNCDSPVTVTVRQGKNKVECTLTNGADDLETKSYDVLFERFYRLDGSRNSKTGGFGIGLAIAKTIVRNHGGDIRALSGDGKVIEFHMEL
ncbi:MAG: HAMP domain-containing sensor histidine kinase [Eubacteriales bacterium]